MNMALLLQLPLSITVNHASRNFIALTLFNGISRVNGDNIRRQHGCVII